MTPKQENMIKNLKETILKHDGLHSDEYEYKKFDINIDAKYNTGIVFLSTEVGRIGDEGTYGELLSRTRRHIRIGKRGGCELLNTGKYIRKEGYLKIVSAKVNVTGSKVKYWTTK